MAYETGTASSVSNLLTKLSTYLLAQGWTINRDVVAGSGRELCVSKGTAFFNMRAYENESMVINGIVNTRYGIALNGSDAYGAGSAWDKQTGYPLRTTTTGGDQAHANMPLPVYFGPFPSYHFFTPNANTVFVELEVANGIFQRFGFGSLDIFNAGASGGGRFFYATGGSHPSTATGSNTWLGSHSDQASYALELVPFRCADYTTTKALSGSFVRVGFDAFDGWAGSARTIAGTEVAEACQGGGIHDKVIRDFSPSPLSGVGILTPNLVSINRAGVGLSPLGTINGMRYVDMTGYAAGEEIILGADTWKIFPWYQKDGITYGRGIALLKV